MTSEVLHAYNFENSKVNTLKKINELPSNGFNWIHLDATHTNIAETLLAKNLSINLIAQKALLEEETRPRMVKFDEGILLILRGVNLNDNADPEDMISLRLWVSDNNIITLRKRKLKAVQDIVKNIEGNNLPNSIGDILCQLVERLAERMQPTIARLNELIDDLEETIIDGEDKEIRESILSIRRKSIVLRRYMKPQADAIEELLSSNLSWLSANHSFWLNQSANNIQRYIEDLEVVRDRSHAVMDEITNKISEKLNRNMYLFSVIAAIFLPLSFLTGLLGINVAGIPGASDTNAFLIFCLILLAVVIIQIVLFKKFKWF
jgi:zinc transporter